MTTRLIMAVLLILTGYFGLEHRTEIVDLYRGAYPDNPAERTALDQCARGIPNFNRFASADRDNCYASVSGAVAVKAVPYSPSHLPASDVRRQEAFDGYQSMRGAAAASMLPPPDRVSR
jgi:hypothetical protein